MQILQYVSFDVEDLWLKAFSESLLLILGDWETNVSLDNVGYTNFT
jgi:hypothetical protein